MTIELQVLKMGRDALAHVDSLSDEAIAQGGTVACRAGCSWCCYLTVTVVAPEVLLLAEHLRANLSAGKLAAVTAQVIQLDAITRGLTPQERAEQRRPCALLVDGHCSVYDVRPLMCRGWNSFDAAQCEQLVVWAEANLPVEYNEILRNVAVDTQTELQRAVCDAGLSDRPLELTTALRIALETPDGVERWGQGDDLFSAAAEAGAAR